MRYYSWNFTKITRHLIRFYCCDTWRFAGAGSKEASVCVIIECAAAAKGNLKSRHNSPRRQSNRRSRRHGFSATSIVVLSIPLTFYKTHFARSTVHHCLYNFSPATSTSSRSRQTPIGNCSFSFYFEVFIRMLYKFVVAEVVSFVVCFFSFADFSFLNYFGVDDSSVFIMKTFTVNHWLNHFIWCILWIIY